MTKIPFTCYYPKARKKITLTPTNDHGFLTIVGHNILLLFILKVWIEANSLMLSAVYASTNHADVQ